MKLAGKVAIVTGSARGIGKAIAIKLASEGAAIIVSDINLEQAQQVADEIRGRGGSAIAVKTDVVNRADVQNLVKTTLENFKAIHILVNNAGVTRHAPLLEMTEEDWDTVIDVNLKGVFNCTQAILGHMIRQKYGKIINISSISGTGVAEAGHGALAPAKAGVDQLTKVTAREAGPNGINVNSIAPGLVVTDMTFTRRTKEEAERFIETAKKRNLNGRVGEPDDIANLALFLASDDAKHINGQVICCDGGRPGRV